MFVLRFTPNHKSLKYKCPNYCYVGFRYNHLRGRVDTRELKLVSLILEFDKLSSKAQTMESLTNLQALNSSKVIIKWVMFKVR